MAQQRRSAKAPAARGAPPSGAGPHAWTLLASRDLAAALVVAGQTVRLASRLAERMLASNPGGLNGRNLWSLFKPEREAARWRERLRGASPRQAAWHFEAAGSRLDGAPIWVDVRLSRSQWEGKPAWLALLTDISQRKRAEAALAASERRNRHLLESSPHGIALTQDGRIRTANRAFAAIFGVEPDAGVPAGTAFTSFLAPRERRRFRDQQLSGAAGPAAPARSEYEGRRVDGSAVRVRIQASQAGFEGEPAILVTVEDIGGRRAEEELRARERLLRSVFDALPVAMTFKDSSQRYTMANRAYLDLFRVVEPDLIGRTAEEAGVLPAKLRGLVRDADGEALATGKPVEIAESEMLQDGVPHVRRIMKIPLLDERGRAQGIVTLSEDITARKRAEEELRANQDLFQQVFDAVPERLFLKDREGRYLRVNRAQAEAMGINAKDFEGLTTEQLAQRLGTGRTVGNIVEEDARVLRTGERLVLPDMPRAMAGGKRWSRMIKGPLRDAKGDTVGVIGLGIDVTGQHQVEDALRANQRLLQTILDMLPVYVTVKDRAGRYQLINRRVRESLPPSTGDLVSRTFADNPETSEERRTWVQEADRRLLETGEVQRNEELHTRRLPGRDTWERITKLPLRDESGQVAGIITVGEDITERKWAEEEMRSGRRLLQTVFDTIPQEVFIKDAQSRFVLANTAFARFYGLTPPQLQGLPSSELPGVPPAEAATWIEQDRKVVETGQPVLEREVRQSGPHGGEVWVDLRKYPWRDDDNRVIGVVGVREDISERRHTEELVRANRRLLRTVFDTIPHLLFVKDVNSRYLMVNQAMANVYGQTPEALAGTSTLDMPDALPEQRQELLESDRMVMRTGTPIFQPEVPLFERGRGTRWYSITKLPLRDEEGKIVGLVGMSEDITERRDAELQHRMDRRLLRAVFDAVPFWLMVRDTGGRATLVNRCMARDYGAEPEDFLGKVMEDDPHLKPEEKAAFQAIAAQVERTLRPVSIPEMSVTLPGGTVRPMRLVDIPLFDDAGRWEGALILMEDITERRRSENALLQAQKLESLGVLAGGIAHDFNNLLVAVLGNASLALLKMGEDAQCREELRQIELAGQRAAELCRQMLAYAGQGRLETQRFDVNGLVHEMAQLLKVSLPKGAAIQFRLAQDLPAVEGDPTQMRQVVMNLVINAGEAIGDKQGVITLTTGTQECDQAYLSNSQSAPDAKPGRFVFVEVSDTGHGMAPATLSRIFDPFFTTKFTGRGLGLASVIGIIRGHRGALRVYSEPGVGTAFRVLLPVAGAASAGQASDQVPPRWAAGGEVLLVDDEAEIRAVAEKMLTYLGFTVVQASNGQEAIAAVRARGVPFLAALVDLTMPGMTGEEVVRELRRFQDLPVLVMSGYHERDVQNRFIGREKTGFLQKPFTLAGLHEKMSALLGGPGAG